MMIEIVADVVCPWCYIGRRRFARALTQRPQLRPRLVWRGFQLNPEMPVHGVARQSYLASKFGGPNSARRVYESISEAGSAEQIEFRFDLIERTPNTVIAHRLSRYASRFGVQDQVMDRMFAGYFEQGRDIGRTEVLAEIAGEAGLDQQDALEFLDGPDEQEAVLSEDRAARRLGINGVPCFIIDGRYALSGAQEPEFFVPLFDLALQEHRALESV